MYRASVLIISKRKELSVKYKKLIEALNHEVFVTASLSEAFKQIPLKEPELIIISDTIEEKLSDFCKKIRALTFNFRPAIIAISKSSEMIDKLQTLEAGADDYLSELISSAEFQARINAHLRRYIENSINPITGFVQNNLTLKTIRKHMQNPKSCAIMLIDVFGLGLYREIYGEIAYEKVLQTLSAIVKSTLTTQDFAGHNLDSEFILIASSQNAEKIASFLTFAFDNVVERFYNEVDYKNKFILYSSDEKMENKVPLMRLGVGVLELTKGRFENHKEILNALYLLLKMCKDAKTSSYLIDRPKLGGKIKREEHNRILITEPDEALLYLLTTVCEMKNFVVKSVDFQNFMVVFKKFKPQIVILDYGSDDLKEGIQICQKIKALKNTDVKIIFSSSIHQKKEILSAGADFYLPKPYDVKVMMNWVERFIV